MRKYFPIIISVMIVGIAGSIVIYKKNLQPKYESSKTGQIKKVSQCGEYGSFFKEKGVIPPVTVDLSQKHHKGIALYFGENQVYHPKEWERFEYFETYTVDKKGNLYLVPMPFISITSKTFELLTNLYKIDTDSGALDIFMHFDDVHPSSTNPFGLKSIIYDCEDDTLWVSAIDESDYLQQKGVIYHINLKEKSILSRYEGYDVLSLVIAKIDQDKFLLFGSAKDNGLYAVKIENQILVGEPVKILEIPNPEEHIRKIKVRGTNKLELQTIPFSYTLIAESSKKERNYYRAYYDANQWQIIKEE